jgi:hypothetical protein
MQHCRSQLLLQVLMSFPAFDDFFLLIDKKECCEAINKLMYDISCIIWINLFYIKSKFTIF